MWIFRNIENALSESALEQGIDRRPYINLHSVVNLLFPSSVLMPSTSDQNFPALDFFVRSAVVYSTKEGRSVGESLKSRNSSLNWSRDSTSASPICGKRLARLRIV